MAARHSTGIPAVPGLPSIHYGSTTMTTVTELPRSTRAARARVKAVLAEGAERAFSAVFDEAFRLYAREVPAGNLSHFKRWYLEALRHELDWREAACTKGGAA